MTIENDSKILNVVIVGTAGQGVITLKRLIEYIAAAEGYDPEKDDNEPSNFPLWSPFDLDEALYDCIREYYTSNRNEDHVELHEPFTGVDSDYEDEL